MIITIDGLSATGKSSVALRLANTLHYLYFNTGLVYRFITYIIVKNHLSDPKEIIKKLNSLDFKLESDKIFLNHKDITSFLYKEEIALYTSKYSSIPEIKDWVRDLQKKYLQMGNIIMEGRDIGTKVAPHADIKFYLYTDVVQRARRLFNRGGAKTMDAALFELQMIDANNIHSKDFIEPKDAIKIDTTHMSLDEVYEYMLKIIKKCLTS